MNVPPRETGVLQETEKPQFLEAFDCALLVAFIEKNPEKKLHVDDYKNPGTRCGLFIGPNGTLQVKINNGQSEEKLAVALHPDRFFLTEDSRMIYENQTAPTPIQPNSQTGLAANIQGIIEGISRQSQKPQTPTVSDIEGSRAAQLRNLIVRLTNILTMHGCSRISAGTMEIECDPKTITQLIHIAEQSKLMLMLINKNCEGIQGAEVSGILNAALRSSGYNDVAAKLTREDTTRVGAYALLFCSHPAKIVILNKEKARSIKTPII